MCSMFIHGLPIPKIYGVALIIKLEVGDENFAFYYLWSLPLPGDLPLQLCEWHLKAEYKNKIEFFHLLTINCVFPWNHRKKALLFVSKPLQSYDICNLLLNFFWNGNFILIISYLKYCFHTVCNSWNWCNSKRE